MGTKPNLNAAAPARRVLQGRTYKEQMASADLLIESLLRKVEALERRIQDIGGDAPRRRDQRLDALEGKVQAILGQLGLQATPNTTAFDLVPAGIAEGEAAK